jgi:hypothetical protein
MGRRPQTRRLRPFAHVDLWFCLGIVRVTQQAYGRVCAGPPCPATARRAPASQRGLDNTV